MDSRSKRYTTAEPIKDLRSEYNLPTGIPISFGTGLVLVGALIIIGLGIGVAVGTQVFFGTAAMIGFAILVESNPWLLWLVERGNIWLDLLIFVASIYAMASLGPTISGALVIFGIEFTAIYAPEIRKRARRRRRSITDHYKKSV